MIFILKRNGNLQVKHSTINQCKGKGHKDYSYEITCLFRNELDSEGFLVEHSFIDDSIQKLLHVGSCEQMQTNIMFSIRTTLVDHLNCPLLAFKCILKPMPNGEYDNISAHLECVESLSEDRYEKLLHYTLLTN